MRRQASLQISMKSFSPPREGNSPSMGNWALEEAICCAMFFSSALVPIGDPIALTSIAATRSLFAFTMNALDRIGCDGSG
jgi:hypothetical protein